VGGFSYGGDTGQRVVRISETREVATGDAGTVFSGFTANAGGATDIGAVLFDLAENYAAGDPDPNALVDIDSALGRVLETRATVGARMNAITEQKTANEAFQVAITQVRSSLEDLDYAEAVSRFNQQLTAFQAAQQTFVKIQDMSLFNLIR
jgi:flagellar hook-associated protein 3 FlgL